MQAYSLDLRERVIQDRGGRAADRRGRPEVSGESGPGCGGSCSGIGRVGQVGSKQRTQYRASLLAPHLPRLAALLAAQPDATLAELRTALGVPVGLSTVWRAVQQVGRPGKKKPARRRPRAS